jgi:cell division protein FtsL
MKIRNEKMDETIHATRSKMNRLVHAYKEAPWRTQRKWLVLFLMGTVAVGMITGIYLDVTSRAALAGREVQVLEADIANAQRDNSDLETQLAVLLSTSNLLARADKLGFVPANPEDINYMPVAGYFPPQPMVMSSNDVSTHSPALDPRFSQSLFGWLDEQMQKAATR